MIHPPSCVCAGSLWVCEEHPQEAWTRRHQEMCGPARPCTEAWPQAIWSGAPAPIEREDLGSSTIRVLLAVASLPRPTIRGVAERASLSPSVVYHHLGRLRMHGLVTWERGKRGTLRALVEEVPFGAG
jgi:DNA-binding transcriptional ArsR family regulator